MLAFCTELDRDWEEGLPWLLLDARVVVQVSTDFSPQDTQSAFHWQFCKLVANSLSCHRTYYVNRFSHRQYMAKKTAKCWLQQTHTQKKKFNSWLSKVKQSGRSGHVSSASCWFTISSTLCWSIYSKKQVPELDYYLISMSKGKSNLCHLNLLKR